MRAFVRRSLLVASASLLAADALAGTNGLYLPPAPTGAGGEDAIETSGGTRCRQSINSNGAYVDMGVTGTTSGPERSTQQSLLFAENRANEATAYARVTIPLGPKPRRIACSEVFDLEIAKLKREIELLKLGVR